MDVVVVTYEEAYKSLDGIVALAVAAATPLRREKDERDTAYVKRIVATYVSLATGGTGKRG